MIHYSLRLYFNNVNYYKLMSDSIYLLLPAIPYINTNIAIYVMSLYIYLMERYLCIKGEVCTGGMIKRTKNRLHIL